MQRKNPLALLFGWLAVTVTAPLSVAAEGGTTASAAERSAAGVITGRIVNAATGHFLEGAVIEITGTNIAGTSETDGTFRLSVPAGLQNLRVTYVGLGSLEKPVQVREGQVVNTGEIRL